MVPIYVIGDVHGQLKQLVHLLRQAHLVGEGLSWTGGPAIVWLMGDLVDRGPDGIGVIDLVMRLQVEATAAQGQVLSLLGDHEVLLLAAYRFGRRSTGLGSPFISKWKKNGGKRTDLARLTLHHLDWLARLPVMAHAGEYLLFHADAPLYLNYGHSVEEVNAVIGKLLKRSDDLAWEELIEAFIRRGAFITPTVGEEFARRVLARFGGQQLVHGHTPISIVRGSSLKQVSGPWVYASDLCINVDGGMGLGGPGFVCNLP